ncbi:MAG: dicarboxylate/amino acid:cation symporter [Candidatus Moduliflexus flocculans]|nr:dicarboxylate/amino acid:cation symporter [Candidatus Moduliflexus flocculans]
MGRTCLNVTGDMAGTAIVSKTEKELDMSKWQKGRLTPASTTTCLRFVDHEKSGRPEGRRLFSWIRFTRAAGANDSGARPDTAKRATYFRPRSSAAVICPRVPPFSSVPAPRRSQGGQPRRIDLPRKNPWLSPVQAPIVDLVDPGFPDPGKEGIGSQGMP